MPKFSGYSLTNLKSAHKDLQKLFNKVIQDEVKDDEATSR
jgi:hypothetical protein